MHLGLVGLGKMGNNMRERMRRAGLTVVGYDRNPEVTDTASLAELVQKLDGPRVVWVMLPIQVVDQVIDELKGLLAEGDLAGDRVLGQHLHRGEERERDRQVEMRALLR